MDSQNKLILKHLKQHQRGITSLDAFTLYNITRLSGRIFDLRNMGYEIKTVDEANSNGRGTHARYLLKE